MTEKTVKASQYIIDLARSAKSFIAAAGEESLPDESLMRAAVTFNVLQRRGMIAAVVRNDDTMCKPHDFDDMYRAHAIALIAHNFTDNPPNTPVDDDMTRRLRHAADTLDEDEDNAPMFAALMRRAALRIEHTARDEQARREFLERAVCHPGPPLSEHEDYDPRADLGELEASVLERMDLELKAERELRDIRKLCEEALGRTPDPARSTIQVVRDLCADHLAARTYRANMEDPPAGLEPHTQPECPIHPRDRPVVPEALDASTRAERERVLALAGQMLRDCAGLHGTMVRRLEALIEDIKCGARTY